MNWTCRQAVCFSEHGFNLNDNGAIEKLLSAQGIGVYFDIKGKMNNIHHRDTIGRNSSFKHLRGFQKDGGRFYEWP
jgi:hypothetical protein